MASAEHKAVPPTKYELGALCRTFFAIWLARYRLVTASMVERKIRTARSQARATMSS